MTWTPPAPPVTWEDSPHVDTPVDANNLNAIETFATTVGGSVVSYFETGASSLVPTEISTAAGNLGASATIDFGSTQNKTIQFTGTLNANCTLTLTNRAAGCRAVLLLTQDSNGNRTLSVSDGFTTYPVQVPPQSNGVFAIAIECPNATDIYVLPDASFPAAQPTANVTETSAVGGNLGTSQVLSFGSVTNSVIQFTGTLNANCTITLSNRKAGCRAVLLLTQDSTGGRSLNISDGSISQAVTVPTLPSASFTVIAECTNTTDIYVLPVVGGPLPTSVVTATNADSLGRTQVLETSTIKAPALPQFASIIDAPWGAKGDAKRVTDGAITTGTNTLSSSSASFTSADTGKRVDVVGAGPAGAGAGTLFAFIGIVASGVASLVTTSGGSTPANATNTVSGAMVTYGTEDTTAWQTAVNNTSTAGGGVLYIPARRYFLNQVSMPSNVTIWGYGATVYFTAYNNAAGFKDPGTAVSNVSIYGLTMPSDSVIYGSGTRIAIWFWTANNNNLRFIDNFITNNKDAAIDIRDAQRVWIVNNTIQNCCAPAGRNAINLFTTSGLSADYSVQGNYVDQCPSYSFNAGTNGATSLTSPATRMKVIGNTFIGNYPSVGGGTGIGFEGAGGGGSEAIIANNIIDYGTTTTVSSSTAGIAITQSINNGDWLRFVIQGNYINHATQAVTLNASWVTFTGNVIESARSGINTLHAAQTVTATLDGTTATLTSVGIPSGSQTPIANGVPVSGTGVGLASYLVSGAGTATWVLSQPTTVAGTVSVTANVLSQGVVITDNVVHMAANSASPGITAANLTGSIVSQNQVTFEPGSSSGSFGIHVIASADTTVRNNSVQLAPADGIRIRSSHDMTVTGNKILNASTAGGAVPGLALYGVTGTDNTIDDNRIIDDRPSPLMKWGIQTILAGVGVCANLRVRRNTLLGGTSGPIDSTTFIIERADNRFTTGLPSGRATLVAGTVTVSTNEVVTGDSILLSNVAPSATIGALSIGTIVNKTSFVIQSTSASDTSTVYWDIRH